MRLEQELSIVDVEGGAIIERMEHELQEVLKDCADVNKEAESVREIVCKIKIKPDINRCVLLIGIETSAKLGKRHPIIARAWLDEETGQAFEPTVREGNLFPDEDKKPEITIIGGSRKDVKNG